MSATSLAVVPPKPRRKRKAKGRRKPTKAELEREVESLRSDLAKARPRSMSVMAWCLCFGLPLISFGASWLAGECFLTGHTALGVASTVLVLFALLVSAPHVAAAVFVSWRTSKLDGWLVAAALEAAIIVLDMAYLAGPESLRLATLIASAVPVAAVAALNAIAVRRAAGKDSTP